MQVFGCKAYCEAAALLNVRGGVEGFGAAVMCIMHLLYTYMMALHVLKSELSLTRYLKVVGHSEDKQGTICWQQAIDP